MPNSKPNWPKVWLIGIWLFVAAVGTVSTTYWLLQVDAVQFSGALLLPGAISLAVVCGLTTLNVALRWLRWHYLTRRIGCDFATVDSVLFYCATLPAIVSPFYLGELVRPLLVSKKYPRLRFELVVLWFFERGFDVLSLVVFYAFVRSGAVAALAVCVLAVIVSWSLARIVKQFIPTWNLSATTQIAALILSVAAWLLPAIGLWATIHSFAGEQGFSEAVMAFSATTLLGGLSGLPQGVGLTGTALIEHLRDSGLSSDTAVLATAVFRLGTTWFAVAGGALTLLAFRRRLAEALHAAPDRLHFDDIAAVYDAQIPLHIRQRLVGRKIELMHKFLAPRSLAAERPLAGLDVGCGQGWYAEEMTKAGYEICGIDPSAAQIRSAVANNQTGRQIDFRVASASTLPFPSESFDFAYAINVMHHIVDETERRQAFAEIVRVLRPGGVFFLHEINTTNPLFRFYIGYIFPLLRSIDEGNEKWLLPRQLPSLDGATWEPEVDYFTFIPDFAPQRLYPWLFRIEQLLEKSNARSWSAHFMARLTRTLLVPGGGVAYNCETGDDTQQPD